MLLVTQYYFALEKLFNAKEMSSSLLNERYPRTTL